MLDGQRWRKCGDGFHLYSSVRMFSTLLNLRHCIIRIHVPSRHLGVVRYARHWYTMWVALWSPRVWSYQRRGQGQPLKSKNTDKAVTWYLLDRTMSTKWNSFFFSTNFFDIMELYHYSFPFLSQPPLSPLLFLWRQLWWLFERCISGVHKGFYVNFLSSAHPISLFT